MRYGIVCVNFMLQMMTVQTKIHPNKEIEQLRHEIGSYKN